MSVNNVENGNHYRELNDHYAEECSQDDIGTFLFTSESVGEGHPGNFICHRLVDAGADDIYYM